jgi:hypothetical protein
MTDKNIKILGFLTGFVPTFLIGCYLILKFIGAI